MRAAASGAIFVRRHTCAKIGEGPKPYNESSTKSSICIKDCLRKENLRLLPRQDLSVSQNSQLTAQQLGRKVPPV